MLGLPPVSMAGGLLSLAGHGGLPPTTSAAAMAAAAAAAAANQGGLHALMRPDLRDDKASLAAIEERMKHSASASPLPRYCDSPYLFWHLNLVHHGFYPFICTVIMKTKSI
jgi:hypothetical protein